MEKQLEIFRYGGNGDGTGLTVVILRENGVVRGWGVAPELEWLYQPIARLRGCSKREVKEIVEQLNIVEHSLAAGIRQVAELRDKPRFNPERAPKEPAWRVG